MAVFAVLLFISVPCFSQSLNIVDIKVAGNKVSSTDLILSVAGISRGTELTAGITQEAIRRLYGLGFFRDVAVDAEEVTGGVSLTIRVVELPKLAGVEYKGNKAIKTKDFEEKLKLATGNYVAPGMIYDKKAEMISLYGDKGFFMAEINPELRYSDDSLSATLIFDIREGSRIKVDSVILTGATRVPAKKIIGQMRNRKRGFLRSSSFDQDKYEEDKEKIITYLHQQGYIDAYLRSDSLAIDTAANKMNIYLDIFEGPRYYFGKAEWKGNEIFKAEMLSRVLKFKEGQIFDQEKYDESTYEIYFLYQEKGYLHVRVVDDRTTRDSLIDVAFDIVEGLPSKVNLVRITGNTKTKEKVIRREMTIMPGQVFNRSLLIRSVRDIMQLNYFGNVMPDMADLPSGDIDLIVNVEEKPTGQISAGAGYSGQDKFVGTFGLGIPNFRGMGQNLSFNIDIGSRRNSYSISFTEPWMFSTPTPVGVDLYFTNRRWYDDYTEGRRGGSLRVGRRLRWPDNYFRVYTRYRLEDNRFYDFSDAYSLGQRNSNVAYYDSLSQIDTVVTYGGPLPGSLLSYNEKWFSSSSLQLTLVRDSRNLPEFATSGSILSYTLENTGGWLGGHWKYLRHTVELAKFIPLYRKIALVGKITYGAISTPSGDGRILESDRFSPGGTGYDGMVRGYEDGSLTPDTIASRRATIDWYRVVGTDTTLDSTTSKTYDYTSKVRGKFMLIGNLELQVPLIENQLYTMLFFDIGNAWLNRRDIRIDDLYKGVGIGFRLVVPGIGTMGFDFGFPLDERPGQKKSWRPHFQVGTSIR